MKHIILTTLALITVITVNAQTWSEIKAKKDIYLFGEGKGETEEEADKNALSNLISQISVTVSKEFTMTEEEKISNGGAEATSYAQSKVKSYANATLTNAMQFIIKEEPNAIVGRCIKRSDVDKIFEGRRNLVMDYVALAEEAEEQLALDNALRLYFWASALLKTLPNPNVIKYTTKDGVEHLLATWIPVQMDNILGGIRVKIIKKEGNNADLLFTYKNQRISSLDYTYLDGNSWSSIYSAKDGRGVLELMPGASFENIRIRFEYRYQNQAQLYDKEVASALNVVKGGVRKKATYVLSMKDTEGAEGGSLTTNGVAKVGSLTTNGMANTGNMTTNAKSAMGTTTEELIANVQIPMVGAVTAQQKQMSKEVMEKVIGAIKSKNYQSIQNQFTEVGYDIFIKLMQYGNARILEQPELTYSKMDKQIVVRSIPMAFQFKNGAVKSFVEEVVFTLNPDGKIDNITFGLGDVATADIMGKTIWREEVRIMIINFLEVYKTAFALKRSDYIESIFDDNAVIITGRVTMRKNNSDADRYAQNRYVVRTRYTKEEYLKHLKVSFASKEFINIRFARTLVKKAQNMDVYGIQIKQDYYSSNYGDSGYLYLQVDMTNPKEPVIKVRTWQDQIDPEVGRPYGMEDF